MVPVSVQYTVAPPALCRLHPERLNGPPVVLWSSIHSSEVEAAVPPHAISLMTTEPAATVGVGVAVASGGVGVGVFVGVQVGWPRGVSSVSWPVISGIGSSPTGSAAIDQ